MLRSTAPLPGPFRGPTPAPPSSLSPAGQQSARARARAAASQSRDPDVSRHLTSRLRLSEEAECHSR